VTSRLQAFVSGKVQGVSYRGFVLRAARDLGLTGWVRNLYDGRVEVLAEGEKTKLEALLGRLAAGPPAARVEDIDIRWRDGTGDFGDFKIAWLDF
jgi:acylphosphatase